jgi:hypothetical protein
LLAIIESIASNYAKYLAINSWNASHDEQYLVVPLWIYTQEARERSNEWKWYYHPGTHLASESATTTPSLPPYYLIGEHFILFSTWKFALIATK